MQSSLRAAGPRIRGSRLSELQGDAGGETILRVRCRRDRRVGSFGRWGRLRQLRRSPGSRFLLDELTPMSDAHDLALRQAIAAICQSDPIIKLLQQVALGRMKPTDAGLRAVTESWLKTYQHVVETTSLDRQTLARIDPRPRIDVLIDAGVLDPGHEAGLSLRRAFEKQSAQAGL